MSGHDTQEDKGTASGKSSELAEALFSLTVSPQLSAHLPSTPRTMAKLNVHGNGYSIVLPAYPCAALPKWDEDTRELGPDPALMSGR